MRRLHLLACIACIALSIPAARAATTVSYLPMLSAVPEGATYNLCTSTGYGLDARQECRLVHKACQQVAPDSTTCSWTAGEGAVAYQPQQAPQYQYPWYMVRCAPQLAIGVRSRHAAVYYQSGAVCRPPGPTYPGFGMGPWGF